MTTRAEPQRPLAVLVLSDGRPGHYHLAEGVAAAIARRRPVTVTRLDVERPSWLPVRVLAALARQGAASARWAEQQLLSAGSAVPELVDLVVSAGGETTALNAMIARRLGVPNIYCGTLKHLPPERFALVVSSYARHAGRPRHLVSLKPSGIDPDTLARSKPAGVPGPPRVAGLLIGGDSGLFRYSDAEWERLVAFIAESRSATGLAWVVSTSRRSPDRVADALASLARRGDGAVLELIDFRSAGPGTLPSLFARVDAVLCTEDSSTMLSEAVCARLPVVGVAPAKHAFKDEEAEYRAFLRSEGWCRVLPLSELTPDRFLAEVAQVRPLAANHLDRLADALAERLPELFAGR